MSSTEKYLFIKELIADRPGTVLWLVGFGYTVIAAVLIQFVVLPYILPDIHAGDGLLKGLDCVSFHQIAVELSEKIKLHGWG